MDTGGGLVGSHGRAGAGLHPGQPGGGAAAVCYPRAHGAPVHVGGPTAIGIGDLDRPDFGDAVPVRAGEVPVFWACGVTPQVALLQARLPLAVTHAPGHMFITDVPEEELDSAWGWRPC